MIIAVPALITLVGTLITVLIGYRQWHQRRDTEGSRDFQNERRIAYKQLWDFLAEVKFKMLAGVKDRKEIDNLLSKTIALIRKHSAYIEHEDGVVAIQYLEDFYEFRQLIPNIADLPKQRMSSRGKEFPWGLRFQVELAMGIAKSIEWLSAQPLTMSLLPSLVWSLFDTIYAALSPYLKQFETYTKIFSAWNAFEKTRNKLVPRFSKIISGRT